MTQISPPRLLLLSSRAEVNTIRLPSGAQPGSYSCPLFVRLTRPDPSGFMVKTSPRFNPEGPVNAILWPSGDQAAWTEADPCGDVVSWVCPVPSAFMDQISIRPFRELVNAMRGQWTVKSTVAAA